MTTSKSDKLPSLDELRDQIDGLDQQLLTLLSQRANCAAQVAQVKEASADGAAVQYYRPEREAQVLRSVMERNQGPLDDEVVARLFREVMSACLALEKPMRVAYLGPEGTFTHSAAFKHFGHGVTAVPLASIDDVFREVASGAVNYGVVPVENSTGGMVTHTLDSFMRFNLHVAGEVALRIHQHLLVSDQNKVENITRIYSHQQSLAQCRQWLDTHMPNVERIAVASNADAAKRIKGEWNAAAIAGETAADLYDLTKHAENIEDSPDNTTRFLIISKEAVPASGNDKTSIIVSTRNKPGALYSLLGPFHEQGISLTRIETRPSPTDTWNYVFFIDFEGHQDSDQIENLLLSLESEASEVRRLGSYPQAVL